MALLDFLLNCACLLLWLSWQSRRLAPVGRRPGVSLAFTVKRAETSAGSQWRSLLVLAFILLARAIVYLEVSPKTDWTPRLRLGAIVLHFRSDMLSRTLLYSLLSFLLLLFAFYASLCLVAAVNRRVPATDLWNNAVQAHLGRLARLPEWALLALPFASAFALWLAGAPLLARLDVLAAPRSFPQLAAEAVIIGANAWLVLRYAIVATLATHMLSTYVYLGSAPIWNFVSLTATNLLRPLRWLPLRSGRLDLLPLAGIGLALALGRFAPGWLAELYARVPR